MYQIQNLQNGKRYIGSSVSVEKRWMRHRSMLRGGYHRNKHLQNAWRKYGESAFEFEILVDVDVSESVLRVIEDLYLHNVEPEYNFALSATTNPMLGKAHTKETRAMISKNNARLSGKNHPMWGKKHTEEAIRKIAAASRGEKNPSAKLIASEVLEIRRLYKNGGITHRELGEQFGVGKHTIGNIVNRKIWKHV